MNVACPQCKTVFRVDPRKVPAEGVRARCSVCGGVFEVVSEGQARGAPAPAAASTPSAAAAPSASAPPRPAPAAAPRPEPAGTGPSAPPQPPPTADAPSAGESCRCSVWHRNIRFRRALMTYRRYWTHCPRDTCWWEILREVVWLFQLLMIVQHADSHYPARSQHVLHGWM